MHHRAESSGGRNDGAGAARGRVPRGRGDSRAARKVRRHAPLNVFVGLCLAATSLDAAPGFSAVQALGGTAAERLSRDWRRIVSADLELVGNASEKNLRRAPGQVENFRDTLRRLVPALDLASGQKTILVALRDPASFQRFAPRDGRGRKQQNVGGYLMVQPYGNVMVLPIYAEAHAYIGVRLLLAGRTDEARKHFLWVKTRGDRNYTEYGLAVAELERLDKGEGTRAPEPASHGLPGLASSR